MKANWNNNKTMERLGTETSTN